MGSEGMEGGVRDGGRCKIGMKGEGEGEEESQGRAGQKDTRWRKEEQSVVLRKEMKAVVAEGDWMVAF